MLDDFFGMIKEALRRIEILEQKKSNSNSGSSLPDQTGHSGEFLSTNGTTPDWAPVSSGITSSVTGETPSGTVNGTNTVFTLANSPVTGSLKLFLNGVRQKLTDDYSISGSTITFVSAPLSGDILLADYFTSSESFTGSTSFAFNETPSGTIDGTNASFSLVGSPVSGTLQLFRDGQLLTLGGDYTLSGSTITFITAPASGSVLLAQYQKNVAVAGNADTLDGYHANITPVANQIPVFDANGFLALSSLGYKIQAGNNLSLSVSAGTADYTITLPTAWATEHLAFFLFAYPLSSWSGVSIQGGGANSLSTGFGRISTTSTQNFKIFWLSIGK